MTTEDDLADVEFDLIDESEPPPPSQDVFARDTAIPAAPPAQIAAEVLLQAETGLARAPLDSVDESALTAPPVRARHLTPATLEPPSSEDLEFDNFDAPIDVFGHPLPGTATAQPSPKPAEQFGQSEMPTAPPVGKSPRPLPAAPSPRPAQPAHAAKPAPARPSADKLTKPVQPRDQRPAFLVETTRNRAPSAEFMARAGSPSSAKRPAPAPAAAPDSALDFVDRLAPLPDSVAPSAARPQATAAPATARQHATAAPVTARAGVREIEDSYAVGDYSRALQIAEQMLARSPDDLTARRYAQNCREVLTQMFAARIGPLDQVISVVVSPEEVQWLALDHRAGFLLSLVDGQSTVDEILDISGMTRLDALKILHDLTEQQVVKLA